MSFAAAVERCLRKYATFEGRGRRSEYWWWMLFAAACSLAGSMIDGLTGVDDDGRGVVTLLVALVLFMPSLAVTVRRLHDTDRSAWFVLIGVVPLVGPIVVLVLCVMDGDRVNNIYGPSTKYPWPANTLGPAPAA
jgi:uncharacterized membrane protein YhaH (DUF805 family)